MNLVDAARVPVRSSSEPSVRYNIGFCCARDLSFESCVQGAQQLPGCHNPSPTPSRRKVLEVPGHQIFRARSLSALQKDVVIRIAASPHDFYRPDPKAFLANSSKRSGHNFFRPLKARPADNLFVFSKDAPADTKLNPAIKSSLEYSRRKPCRLEQRRNNDVRIENNPDHEPGCDRDSRRAFRAAAISASISSIES